MLPHRSLPLVATIVALVGLSFHGCVGVTVAAPVPPEWLAGSAALRVFQAIDSDSNGIIMPHEFEALAAAIETAGHSSPDDAHGHGLDGERLEVTSSLAQATPLWDANGDGGLGLQEFAAIVRHLRGSLTGATPPDAPTQVHLMSNGTSSVCVMWVTGQKTQGVWLLLNCRVLVLLPSPRTPRHTLQPLLFSMA